METRGGAQAFHVKRRARLHGAIEAAGPALREDRQAPADSRQPARAAPLRGLTENLVYEVAKRRNRGRGPSEVAVRLGCRTPPPTRWRKSNGSGVVAWRMAGGVAGSTGGSLDPSLNRCAHRSRPEWTCSKRSRRSKLERMDPMDPCPPPRHLTTVMPPSCRRLRALNPPSRQRTGARAASLRRPPR